MIDQTGAITENGVVKGQIQLITNGESRRVQLYSADGFFLCECPFTGDDDRGFEQGQSLYIGYTRGWANASAAYTKSVHQALSQKQPMEV